MRLTLEKTRRIDIPNDEDNGFVTIKALSMDHLARIESRCTQTMMDGNEDVQLVLDDYKRANRVATDCLTGWGNMFDTRGKELKFNRKNVMMAANLELLIENKRMRFLDWVDQEHAKFREEVNSESIEASGN